MIWELDLAILILVIVAAIGAIQVKDLLSCAILFGAYSFLMCLLWAVMGAVDVAFTEASVGAGASTVFFCGCRISNHPEDYGLKAIGLIIVVLVGALLLYATRDFPSWGDPESPASTHIATYHLEKAFEETSVPNVVTAVLADYRGFDTMFETGVIFCAGLGCFVLLRLFRKREDSYYRHVSTGITLHIKSGNIPDASSEFERIDTLWTPYDLIVKAVCRILAPFVQLFGLYVIAHGHHSPGGGFQGGGDFRGQRDPHRHQP